jgi:hypothetical protein
MGTLFRAFLVVILLVFVAGYFLGYSPGSWLGNTGTGAPAPNIGTSGTIDTDRARERGAELGEKAAVATQKIQASMAEAAVTTKIKAKMALDDTLKARTIDVSTEGSTVTLTGQVPSEAAHARALALARETDGVSVVIDHLEVAGP